MQGEIINGFELKRLLGEGGMAEVWYAENEIGKPAAIKILNENLTRNAQIVERFHNEAIVMVKLKHPNIRQVYGYGYLGNRHCIIMEYLEGDDLSDMMKAGRRFTDAELRQWWNQIVNALDYTHKQGIVHRDIKPSNLFLDEDGTIKLLDFGIAKMMENSSLTQTGSMMGTLMYMSPEQVKDSKSIDYHTDIYSLAVTFVHLLTGKKPYDTDTTSDFQIRERIVYTPFDVSVLPEDWRGFLAPYLEKEPQNRPELRKFEPTPQLKPAAEPQHGETTTVSTAPTPSKADAPQKVKTQAAATHNTPAQQDAPKRKSKAGLFIGLGVGLAVVVAAVVALVLLMKPNPDTETFKACSSMRDYRAYMREYGINGRHYNEAKTIVDRYVADSTEKAQTKERERQRDEAEQKEKESFDNCTTVAACDSYLKAYPHGKYVTEVKAKKTELEKKDAEIAAAKREAEKAKQEAEKAKKEAERAKKEAEKAAEKKKSQEKTVTPKKSNNNTTVKPTKNKNGNNKSKPVPIKKN